MNEITTNGHGALAELEVWKASIDSKLAPMPPPKPWTLPCAEVPEGRGVLEGETIVSCIDCGKSLLANATVLENAPKSDYPTRAVTVDKGETFFRVGRRFAGCHCRYGCDPWVQSHQNRPAEKMDPEERTNTMMHGSKRGAGTILARPATKPLDPWYLCCPSVPVPPKDGPKNGGKIWVLPTGNVVLPCAHCSGEIYAQETSLESAKAEQENAAKVGREAAPFGGPLCHSCFQKSSYWSPPSRHDLEEPKLAGWPLSSG